MGSVGFNGVLLEISNSLTSDQLEQMKYLCDNETVRKRDKERIDSGWRLFQLLTERQKLGEDNIEYVCQLLQGAQRPDLVEKLRNYDGQPGNGVQQPPETERVKLDIATEVIAENLGKMWRKLGRKLGLTDTKLESISRKHPTDLEETAMELLKEWRKICGAEACSERLIKALRDCNLNLTADKIEDRLLKHTCQ
ncbi:protein FADD [Cheilinus undulatus]|uniref:protein FADD n=1 Tax=Cheilinus undulatus TaxID=241271 RepID=UPI001BD27DF5|nr:protein FADD [Cheilinus undulatus]